MRLILFVLLIMAGMMPSNLFAQQGEDPTVNLVDDIQFDLYSSAIQGDTLEVKLFAISYDKNPREFRMNVFASGLVDTLGQTHLFHSVQADRVVVQLADRQNYLNYLLHQDKPVQITLKVAPVSQEISAGEQVKLVFSSLEEEGRFLEAFIDLESDSQSD